MTSRPAGIGHGKAWRQAGVVLSFVAWPAGWASPSSRGRGVGVLWAVVRCSAGTNLRKKKSVDFWQKISLHQIFGKNCVGYKRPKVSCFKQKTPKSKEQREKREQREEEREKISEEMRGERNFRNKYQLVQEGSEMKNIDFLIFTKCIVAFHF